MSLQKVTYPDINGNRYSFASIEAVFNGLNYSGFKSISYSNMLEPADVYGAAPQKIGRTRGKQNAEASFTMYKEEYENLRTALAALAGGINGYMEVPFDILVTYFEQGQIPILDAIVGARITKDEDSHSGDNSDALVVNVTLNVMRILRTGASPTLLAPLPM